MKLKEMIGKMIDFDKKPSIWEVISTLATVTGAIAAVIAAIKA